MRAARLHQIGGLPQVDEIEEPDGDDVISVTCSSLNPVDISTGTGRFYGGVPETPYVIGSEAVGTTSDGRRVWYYAKETMAERVRLAQPDRVAEIPDGVDDRLAVACGTAGLTGWLAVSWRARVTPDDTVLVLGASGTLGATAIQGAKLLGAARVIGAARRVENDPRGRRRGGRARRRLRASGGDRHRRRAVGRAGGEGARRRGARRALRPARPVRRGRGVARVRLDPRQDGERPRPLAALRRRRRPRRRLPRALRARPRRPHPLRRRDLPLDEVAGAWERQASGSPGVKIVVDVAG